MWSVHVEAEGDHEELESYEDDVASSVGNAVGSDVTDAGGGFICIFDSSACTLALAINIGIVTSGGTDHGCVGRVHSTLSSTAGVIGICIDSEHRNGESENSNDGRFLHFKIFCKINIF